jgi:hypothetical protein
MALWGNNDNVFSTGTVSLNYTPDGNGNFVVTGSGTSFGQVGSASTGDVIRFGSRSGTYYGDAAIVGIASTTQLSIASTSGLSGAAISGAQFEVSQLPKYTIGDVKYSESASGTDDSYVYGVDSAETAVAVNTQYGVSHAGWVGVTTYMDNSANPPVLRVKSEVLVAMSSIVNDASDDSVFADAIITIISHPASVGVGTTQTATFSVSASVIPSSATLGYQWQQDPDTGTFANLVGQNSTSVNIANTNASKDDYKYRVVITSGDVSVTSNPATMTVS